MADSFVFYKSFFEGIEALPEDAQAKAYASICKYALFGEEPQPGGLDYVVFVMARAQIDANNKKREAGRKGGESKQNEAKTKQNEAQPKQTEAKGKQTEAKGKQNEANSKQSQANVNVNANANVNVNDNNIDHPSDARPSDSALEKEFEELWAMYPRKEGREAAKKSYITARKSKMLPTSMDDVRRGLNAYCEKIKAEETEKRYIMQGSTFFRGRRWTDDFTITPRAAPNKFSQGMETHEYNWDELERDLLA